mmetsp:Transcript_9011/g.22853  ORF Transcript_9011/g.22853 Transcript_9011/m.22853 type:complete len:143 (-) Transcript_9011:279-707(-)|eukprot:CAMPEP_0197421902 /NCGR_PEP_ID=MMETSP1170-20131217/11830_1 /TAXON_ID=54406 /ORGANISM="Sarcinochrysis sp, Strain CCMP770" /LENGTH=142 /DNA_ID=CAMNT_0042949191 /DNA_START=47 /DNA_END=475 /DNA_ORIENTATION=+
MLAPTSMFRSRFDDVFDDMIALKPTRQVHSTVPTMALDLAERDTDFKVTVDVPGIERENITLDVTKDNTLVIKAERNSTTEEKDDKTHYHRVERSYGAVTRSIRLPDTADADTTAAKLENGVLEITVGKRTQPKTHNRITIE